MKEEESKEVLKSFMYIGSAPRRHRSDSSSVRRPIFVISRRVPVALY